ncbi:hypothetical protein GCM10027614_49580 [Micromonospora vulcania]
MGEELGSQQAFVLDGHTSRRKYGAQRQTGEQKPLPLAHRVFQRGLGPIEVPVGGEPSGPLMIRYKAE